MALIRSNSYNFSKLNPQSVTRNTPANKTEEVKVSADTNSSTSNSSSSKPATPKVSQLVVNNKFLTTYNKLDITSEVTKHASRDIAKEYKIDSSVLGSSELAQLYKNSKYRETSFTAKALALKDIKSMFNKDLESIIALVKNNLIAQLGDDCDQTVLNSILEETRAEITKYFDDNKITNSTQKQYEGFVFVKANLRLANNLKGKYSYNVKSLVDKFVKTFNQKIENKSGLINANYAAKEAEKWNDIDNTLQGKTNVPTTGGVRADNVSSTTGASGTSGGVSGTTDTPVIKRTDTVRNTVKADSASSVSGGSTSIFTGKLQELETQIYTDPSVLKTIQSNTKTNVTSLEDYRETITAILLRSGESSDLKTITNMIAAAIDLGLQGIIDDATKAAEKQLFISAQYVEDYLNNTSSISYTSFTAFLKTVNPKITNEEILSATTLLTSFAAQEILNGCSAEEATSKLTEGVTINTTPAISTYTRSAASDKKPSWTDKVKEFCNSMVTSREFKAAICIMCRQLGVIDRQQKAKEFMENGEFGKGALVLFDPNYYVGQITSTISSNSWYNSAMLALSFIPEVGTAAGLVDFGVSMSGALYNYTYDNAAYGASFPFKTDDMSNSVSANCHLIFDALTATLGVLPGVTSKEIQLSLSGLKKVFEAAGVKLNELGKLIKNTNFTEIFRDIASAVLNCKTVEEAKQKVYQMLLERVPDLAALLKNVLIEQSTENNTNYIDPNGDGSSDGNYYDPAYSPNGDSFDNPLGGDGFDFTYTTTIPDGSGQGSTTSPEGSTNDGWTDTINVKLTQGGKEITAEPTEKNEQSLMDEIKAHLEEEYGTLDEIDYRITFTYDDNGNLNGAVVGVTPKNVPSGNDNDNGTTNGIDGTNNTSDKGGTQAPNGGSNNSNSPNGSNGGYINAPAGINGTLNYDSDFVLTLWEQYLSSNGANNLTQTQMENAWNVLLSTIESGHWEDFTNNYLKNNSTTWTTGSGSYNYGNGYGGYGNSWSDDFWGKNAIGVGSNFGQRGQSGSRIAWNLANPYHFESYESRVMEGIGPMWGDGLPSDAPLDEVPCIDNENIPL